MRRNDDLTPAERLARTADPTILFADAGLSPPHPEQARVLHGWRRDTMLLWSRQAGKSTTGAILACHNLLFPVGDARPTIVIVSRAERQSGELFRKAREIYGRLPYAPPLKTDSATVLEAPSGGRILAYPGSEDSIRGLSAATLALIDEASLVPSELRDAVSPMLVTTNGPIWSMATPRGCRGWFYEDFTDTDLDDFVVKSKLPWDQVPHLSREFIEKERRRMTTWAFQAEYECEFVDADETALITGAAIDRCVNPEVRPLW